MEYKSQAISTDCALSVGPDLRNIFRRRCMRFLERVLSKPILRLSAFEAGCAQVPKS
jgi:hypothetical protein